MIRTPLVAALRLDQASVFRSGLLILLSTALITISNALVRFISQGLHPFEIAFFRITLGFLPLAAWACWLQIPLPTQSTIKLYLLRAGVSTATILLYFLSLSLIPLAEATAINFTAPLFTCGAAALFLKERAKSRHLIAMGLGFVGTMIILRPGIEAVQLGSLAMLGASALIACVLVMIKFLSYTQSSLGITVFTFVFQIPLLFLAMLPVWQTPTSEQWPFILAMAICGTSGQLAMTQAFKDAPINSILPLDFFKLIWASLVGVLMFGEYPSLFTWIGGILIFFGASIVMMQDTQKVAQIDPVITPESFPIEDPAD